MAFNKTDLDNIKSKILISSELEKKTKIIKKGKDIWCCCPFHNEKTPSCKINDDLGSFYCFGCGAKGDIFTIYKLRTMKINTPLLPTSDSSVSNYVTRTGRLLRSFSMILIISQF